jgi:excisionase family DNA binding protein
MQHLTLIEAAKVARCHERTLRRACKRGELKHGRPFGKIIIRLDDLERFLRKNELSCGNPVSP